MPICLKPSSEVQGASGLMCKAVMKMGSNRLLSGGNHITNLSPPSTSSLIERLLGRSAIINGFLYSQNDLFQKILHVFNRTGQLATFIIDLVTCSE